MNRRHAPRLALLLLLAAWAPAWPALAQDRPAEPSLGRLFFTPEQRAALDARRRARVPDKPAAGPVVTAPATRVDGLVRRSQGPSTVFVNGEPVTASEQPDGVRILRERGEPRVSMPVGEGSDRISIRPGQVFDRDTGEVRDVLGDGDLKVRPRPPQK